MSTPKTSAVPITVREDKLPGIRSNMAIPISPFVGLIIADNSGNNYVVLEVRCLAHNFAEDNILQRDPFGNSISVLVKPKQ